MKLKQLLIWGYAIAQLFISCHSKQNYLIEDKEINVTLALKSQANILFESNADEHFNSLTEFTPRLIIGVYLENKNIEIERRIICLEQVPLHTINIEEEFTLSADKFYFMIWLDYAEKDNLNDKFYICDNLHSIPFLEPYISNTDYRDCLSAIHHIDLTSYNEHITESYKIDIDLERHVGKYILIADDVQSFIEKMNGLYSLENMNSFSAVVTYATYMPFSYNILTRQANDAKPGISFTSQFELLSDQEVVLCFDYPLIVQGNISIGINIFDHNNELIKSLNDIKIFVEKDQLTVLRANLLSSDNTPGIGINPDYDGEIDIVIDD